MKFIFLSDYLVWSSVGPSMLQQMALFHSFSWLSNILLCICILFIYSSVDGHLGCFHVLAIVNNAVNIGVHIHFWTIVFSGYMPRNGIAESDSICIFNFLWNLHTVLKSVCYYPQFTDKESGLQRGKRIHPSQHSEDGVRLQTPAPTTRLCFLAVCSVAPEAPGLGRAEWMAFNLWIFNLLMVSRAWVQSIPPGPGGARHQGTESSCPSGEGWQLSLPLTHLSLLPPLWRMRLGATDPHLYPRTLIADMTKEHWAANPRAQSCSGPEPQRFQSCYVGGTPIQNINRRSMAEMQSRKAPSLPPTMDIKTASICRAAIDEKDLETSRKMRLEDLNMSRPKD